MIRELKTSEHVFTDEQQVEAVIRSLPKSWEHMVVNMTHNESVKTFNDIVHHLELKVERLVVARSNEQAYVVKSSSRKNFDFKRNRKFFKKNKKIWWCFKERKKLRHAKNSSALRGIRASWNATIVATSVTSLASALSQNRYGPIQITHMLMFLAV